MMIPIEVLSLIRDEQYRQEGRFVPDLETYIKKLSHHAELFVYYAEKNAIGFIFTYCNNYTTRDCYIPLIAVSPEARGRNIGKILIKSIFNLALSRGFQTCRLEVLKNNLIALSLYKSLGFEAIEDHGERLLMAINLATTLTPPTMITMASPIKAIKTGNEDEG